MSIRIVIVLLVALMASPAAAQPLQQLWGQSVAFPGVDLVPSVKWPVPATNSEAVDDFEVYGTISRVTINCGVCYPCSTPTMVGVRVRFYSWTATGPGMLITQGFYPANSPNLIDAGLTITVNLATPFIATGRYYFGMQLESSTSTGWGWNMTEVSQAQPGPWVPTTTRTPVA